MKKHFFAILVAGMFATSTFTASALVVQYPDGSYWDCTFRTNSQGETVVICVPIDHMPPDLNP